MSRISGYVSNCGGRRKEIKVTRYYGGRDKGVCFQLTQEMEDDPLDGKVRMGYVQLSFKDALRICGLIIKDNFARRFYGK